MVSLAALISAYQEAEEPGGGLRATLPLAGRTLVERQARIAAAVGANPIILLVERIPELLLAAIDRLKGEGFKLIVARNAQEAADAVHPEDRLLMMADGLVAGQSHLERLIGAGPTTLLTVPDLRVDDRFERIDAHSRWAGLALLDGNLLQRTASGLRDWDLQSTLLRRAVQGGARQLALRGDAEDDQLTVAEHQGDLIEMQARIMEGASSARPDWVSRVLLAPVEALGVQLLMPGPVSAGWLSFAAVLLTGLAAGAFAAGWLWLGMTLLLLATPLEGIAERLAALRMQLSAGPSWWTYLLPAFAVAALGTLSLTLAREHGWGCVVLAASTIAFAIAQRVEKSGRQVRFRTLLAERKGMAWLLLPFAATGLWVTGLAVIAAYATASFFWVQRQVHLHSAPSQDD